MQQSTVRVLTGIMCILIGFLIFYLGYKIYSVGAQSQNWPNVTGSVTNISVFGPYCNKGCTYYPSIVYAYSVDGVKYTGSNLTVAGPAGGFAFQSEAENFYNKTPVGSGVVVYYDPNRPYFSVLAKGVQSNEGLFLLMGGIMFFVVGILFIYTRGQYGRWVPPQQPPRQSPNPPS